MSFASSLSSFLPASIASAFASAPSHTKSLIKDIRIKRLRIHPIKSCRGFDVDSVEYDQSGFKYDRTWLIIDATTRNFYTARDLPKMVLIEPTIDYAAGMLNIKIPTEGEGDLVISTPLNPTPAELSDCELVADITIWGAKVDGYAVSNAADDALSLYFGKPVRLVRKGPLLRPSGPHPTAGPTRYSKEDASVNMQDFYPILVTSEASFEHIRSTIIKSVFPERSDVIDPTVTAYKVPGNLNREFWTPEYVAGLQIDRFRPNIVLGDAPAPSSSLKMTAFEEDGWEAFEIIDSSKEAEVKNVFGKDALDLGQGIYTLVRCARCMVPNIDPATGVRDAHLPYRITIQSRQVDPTIAKPCFGMLSCPREASGTLNVGDIVRVTSTADPDAPNRTLMSAFASESST